MKIKQKAALRIVIELLNSKFILTSIE